MKTLVFSDTHFSRKFEQKRFDYLTKLIKSVDKVIINGDFFEGYTTKFGNFLNSKWSKLFPLLKEKQAVYLYGNHDDKKFSDERVYEFCEEATKNYALETNGKKYFFTHGENFLYPKHEIGTEPTFSKGIRVRLLSEVQNIIFRIFGASIFPKKFNYIPLEVRKSVAPMDALLVCGHTHTPQYNKDLDFVDIGFFNYGWANYMIINDDGGFELKSERY